METSENPKHALFWEAYGAHVSDRLPDKGARFWSQFIDRLPAERIESLVREVADQHAGRSRLPRLADFERMWAVSRPDAEGQPREQCGVCGGDGLIAFVGTYFHRVENKGAYWAVGLRDGGRQGWCTIPCRCSTGQRIIRQSRSRFDEQTRDAAFEWRTETAKKAVAVGMTAKMYGDRVLAGKPIEPVGGPVAAPHRAGEPDGIEPAEGDPGF